MQDLTPRFPGRADRGAHKALAGERGYQTLINDTLRRAVEGEHFVQEMRSAIREELASYSTVKK